MEGKIYAVRTTIGQEKNVADMMYSKIEKDGLNIYSILVPHEIRGYVLVEAINKSEIEKSLYGVSHVRGVVEGEVDFEEIEKFFEPKPLVTRVDKGDIIELISGPFKGEKARVVRVDIGKEEITVELFEATVPIPVTVRGDSIKLVRKEEA
jgi:transcriptional antiterminator NusG